MKAIINGKIMSRNKVLENKVLIFNEQIMGLEDEAPLNCEVIDAKGLYVSPGLIDVHIHGSCGFDTMDDDPLAIKHISQCIAKKGVTSFLPTTMTMEAEAIYKALEHVRYWMNQPLEGATVLGAHLEGPFINETFKGAQPAAHMIKPSFDFIKDYLDVIKLITYAPELDENHYFTKKVKAKTKITLSMGHTNASYEEAVSAFACGCSHVTHLFNGMRPLNHREPGAVGAALSQDVFCELIADMIHVNPGLYQFVLHNKGRDKVVLITDSMRAGCMKDGHYDLGGQPVRVKNGVARLEAGSLAGSVLTLNQGVHNFYRHTDTTIVDAVHMAALNPAKSLGISHRKGSLELGKDADIALFNDEFSCFLTICEGRVVYNEMKTYHG